MLRLARNLHFKVYVLLLLRNLHCKVHKVLRMPRNLRFKLLTALRLSRNHTKSALQGPQSAAPSLKSDIEGQQNIEPATKKDTCKEKFTSCSPAKVFCSKNPSNDITKMPNPSFRSRLPPTSENEPHAQRSRFTVPATESARRSITVPISCACHEKSTLDRPPMNTSDQNLA